MPYQPRRARESPLYRIIEDHLETFLSETGASPEYHPAPFVEPSMRAFLECGVPRFGVVRFKCPSCGKDLFVPFSCKRRGACPSCDAKRSVATVSHAMDELLPCVPYRQWVLVVPKRLRYFIHHNPSLAGKLSHILAWVLTRFYRSCAAKSAGAGRFDGPASPVQIHFIQSFGFRLNLHLHLHAVVSDGVFSFAGEGSHKKLAFVPASGVDSRDIERLMNILRRRIFRQFVKLGAIPQEVARDMLNWPHGGFSLDASVRVEADDRLGLKRVLSYCMRPAISLKRLEYLPELDLVRYRPSREKLGFPAVLEWNPVEFFKTFSRLIPAPRYHLVRYAGAPADRVPLWGTAGTRSSA